MPRNLLDREEYIEQAYFFRVYRERLEENVPAQNILDSIHEEILSTTNLPMAIDFLHGEILLTGRVGEGMTRLAHYFTPFQAFVIQSAEADRSRFDLKVALAILQHEAEFRTCTLTPAGLFVYQFECISRNKLGYDRGMEAMAGDPMYDDTWREWMLRCRRQLGAVDFADIIFLYSEHYVNERRRATRDADFTPQHPILFGAKEGRIAWANRGKDPLYMFAALQRQLGYPTVPRVRSRVGPEKEIPQIQAQIQQLEKRIQLLEAESRGNLDISAYYVKPDTFPDDVPPV